ncbi:MAG: ATP synthase F1 subunit epsilon [Candidatus Sumerlaeaceae bacterium]|jgi:F-type H+-transporting ATPase subunit epsilon
MAQRFRLQIFTQEAEVLNRDVVSVTLPGGQGYFGVLAHHAPLVASLGRGKLTIRCANDEVSEFMIEGGFAHVSDNVLTVLADQLVDAQARGT